MTYPLHVTDKTLTAFIDGVPYITDRSNPNFETIRDLLNDPATSSDQLINAFKPINVVAASLAGVYDVEIRGGEVLVSGVPVDTPLTRRLLDLAEAGLDTTAGVKFAQNVYANPFTEAREELYTWLELSQMPITPDGCFLAYKIVDHDYLDRHSRTFDNSVGKVVSMPREECDNTSRALCSNGLHFCSKDYFPTFGIHPGDHVMIVKINPADVVSIPRNQAGKGRAWRWEVVSEISPDHAGVRSWLPVDPTWDTPEFDDELEPGEEDENDSVAAVSGLTPGGSCRSSEDVPISVRVKDADVTVKTKQYGDLTFHRFIQLRANNGGTNAGLAKALDVPAGTVGKWLAKFKAQGCKV